MRLEEFKQLNQNKGFHWFDRDTLSFFSSKVNKNSWDFITGYFISSEKNPNMVRKYSLRKADFVTGNVKTIGEFQAYRTLAQAKTALKQALKGNM